jgi:hypothetical protein
MGLLVLARKDRVFLCRNFDPVHADDLVSTLENSGGGIQGTYLSVNHEAKGIRNIALKSRNGFFRWEKLIAAFIPLERAWLSKCQLHRIYQPLKLLISNLWQTFGIGDSEFYKGNPVIASVLPETSL